jgi:hypothetical protein
MILSCEYEPGNNLLFMGMKQVEHQQEGLEKRARGTKPEKATHQQRFYICNNTDRGIMEKDRTIYLTSTLCMLAFSSRLIQLLLSLSL